MKIYKTQENLNILENPGYGPLQNILNIIGVYSYSIGSHNKSQEPYFGVKKKAFRELGEQLGIPKSF